MRTEAQAEASRANGAMGHGPVTPEGKERSSRNAWQHGLAAEKFTVMDEEDADFEAYRQEFLDDLQPADALEGALAERVISLNWRLRRAAWMEAGMIRADQWEAHRRETEVESPGIWKTWEQPRLSVMGGVLKGSMSGPSCSYEVLGRYERRLERGFLEAVRELRALRKDRQNVQGPTPNVARRHASAGAMLPLAEACPEPVCSGTPSALAEGSRLNRAATPGPTTTPTAEPMTGPTTTPTAGPTAASEPAPVARSSDPNEVHPDSVRYVEEMERSPDKALREAAARIRASLALPPPRKS